MQRNFRDNSLAQRNYIANNLQNSQVEVCSCALRNTPVDLAKAYYLSRKFRYITIVTYCNIIV